MKRRFLPVLFASVLFLMGTCLGICTPCVWAGQLRIILKNGHSRVVPYYWEQDGQIKFEIPGGVAGIPKSEVASIQEVVDSQEFDPQALLDTAAREVAGSSQQKLLQQLVKTQTPVMPAFRVLTPQEGIQMLKKDGLAPSLTNSSTDQVYGPSFSRQASFPHLVRLKKNGLVLLVENVLSSRAIPKHTKFTLTLYDSAGKVWREGIPCQWYRLKVNPKTRRQLGINGQLITVVASFKPNPNISRYEITTREY